MMNTSLERPATQRLAQLVLRHKKSLQGLVALITLALGMTLLGLKVNSSPYFMNQAHESRIHELDIKRLFSNSGEQILVVLKPSSGNPLDRESIATVRALTSELEKVTLRHLVPEQLIESLKLNNEIAQLLSALEQSSPEEFSSRLMNIRMALGPNVPKALQRQYEILEYLYAPVVRVRSLSTIENLTSTEDEIDLHPLLPDGELSKDQLEQFQQEARDNPLYRGLLLSEDLAMTSIQIELRIPKDDNRNTGKVYEAVVALIENHSYQGELFLAGNPVIDAEMSKSMQRDNLIFFPFVMLIVSGILYACFRRLSGIYVPLTIAGTTTIWTLGIMVAMGIEQNIVTTILPVFLLTVAVADAIHFYNHYLHSEASTKAERLDNTFERLLKPLVLTSITTLIGFLALAWTDITFIKEFGLLMALGVVLALVITIILAPIIIPENERAHREGSKIQETLVAFTQFLLRFPVRVLVAMSVVLAGSIYSLQYLSFDQENINNFDESTTLRSHNTAILEHFDGTIPIDIWVDTGKQGGIYDPEIIRQLANIESYLEQRPGIGFVLSPVDFLARMYDLLTFEGHALPEDYDAQLIAQLLLVYDNERSQDIKNVIDDLHRHARFIVLGESDAASFWAPILNDVQGMEPTGTTLEINGYGKVMFSNIEEVIKTNISSTALALVLIGLVMIVLFKSFSLGVIGILPLILTVVMNYAVMSALGISVDVGTTIIASIAFGIGIDYSIHYLSEIQRQQKQHALASEAFIASAKIVGLPIVVNSLTLAGGFLVLALSDFMVIKLLGIFISMTMLLSAVNALITIPCLMQLVASGKGHNISAALEK